MKKQEKRHSFSDELELGMRAPLQFWGGHTVYTEDCGGILDLGEDYIRFLCGRTPVTVFGSGMRVEEFKSGRLLLRGRFSTVEFG